jgi:hypothetical protein
MEDEDGTYLAEMLRVLSEAEAWAARTNVDTARLRPARGSTMQGDDNQAQPYHLSHAAWHLLSNAVDHLGCLRALVGDAKVIHMYAPFSLVRGALESACGAVWLLQPPQRNERLGRRFRLAIADIRNGEQARKLTGRPGPRTAQERIDQIYAIARRAGIEDRELKAGAGFSGIIKTVDQSGPANGVIEASWRLCSGFAHGDWWTTLSGSRRTLITRVAGEDVGTLKIEANLGLLMQVTALAIRQTGYGWQLYDQRCMSPYDRPAARVVAQVPEAFRRSPQTRA